MTTQQLKQATRMDIAYVNPFVMVKNDKFVQSVGSLKSLVDGEMQKAIKRYFDTQNICVLPKEFALLNVGVKKVEKMVTRKGEKVKDVQYVLTAPNGNFDNIAIELQLWFSRKLWDLWFGIHHRNVMLGTYADKTPCKNGQTLINAKAFERNAVEYNKKMTQERKQHYTELLAKDREALNKFYADKKAQIENKVVPTVAK